MKSTVTTVEDIKVRLRAKASAVVAFLNTDTGKAVMDALEEEFYDGDIMDIDPHVTAYNLGRRDVVVYLKQLKRYQERT